MQSDSARVRNSNIEKGKSAGYRLIIQLNHLKVFCY